MTLRTPSETAIATYASCVALGYTALLAAGAVVTQPTLTALSELGTGALPDGDRVLFEPGALLLLEVLRMGRARLASVLGSTAVLVVVTTLTLVPVSAALMVRLQHRRALPWRAWLAHTLSRVPTFLVLGGVTMLARASILVLLVFSATHYHDILLLAVSPRAADLTLLGGGLLVGLAMGVLGGCQDLARAVAITQAAFGWDALRGGLSLARRYPLRCVAPWLIANSVTLGATLVVAWSAAAFDLSGPGACRPLADFLLSQAAIAVALLARIWWFDRALRLARTPELA